MNRDAHISYSIVFKLFCTLGMREGATCVLLLYQFRVEEVSMMSRIASQLCLILSLWFQFVPSQSH